MRLIAPLAFLLASTANAAVIDFEEYTSNGLYSIASTQGYLLTSDQFYIGIGPGAGNSYGLGLPSENILTLANLSSPAFALESVDALAFTGSSPLIVTGYFAAGGQVSTSVAVIGGVDSDMGTYSFSNAWQGLSSVTFQIDENLNLDNIVVTAIPIPASVWLFGSALAGLGLIRRKQVA